MRSPTEICSKALVLLGQNPIADIDDTAVPNAVKCKALYPLERDALLREFDWGFARKRASLQQMIPPAFGYTYAYQLPPDCCAVRSINGDWSLFPDQMLFPYEVENGLILTDLDTCNLVYTARIEESGLFDSLFADCLAIRIARSLAYSVLKKPAVAQAMNELYLMTRPIAKRVDASESQPKQPNMETQSSWLRARGS